MIDAGRKAIEEKRIDTYSMKYGAPGYIVTVTSGKSDGVGKGESEEKAFQTAFRNLKKD